MVGVVVKALEGREERQGLDLRRCVCYTNMVSEKPHGPNVNAMVEYSLRWAVSHWP